MRLHYSILIKQAAVLIIYSTITISCSKDFLNNTPKGYKLATTALDYNNMLEENTLSSMDSYVSGSGTSFPAAAPGILGDDVATLFPALLPFEGFYGGTAEAARNLFQWADDIWPVASNSNELQGGYNRIYISNKIINEVMSATTGTDQQKKQYRAEGLANRAFNYYFLMNLFTKPYNVATAGTDPGLPLVTLADAVESKFERATLQKTYDFVLDDLKAAIPDLPLQQTSANRFTKSSAEALLGKIYLFMGNYTDAVIQLDAAFNHLPSQFTVSGNIGLINYNTATQNPYPITAYVFTVPGLGGSGQQHPYPESLLSRAEFTLTVGGNLYSGIMVTPETLSMFLPSDKRLDLFSSSWGVADGQPGIIPFGLKRVNAGNLGFSVGMQLPDMYLLRAEAKARTGNLAAATESLLTLRRNRMPEEDALKIPTAKDNLIRFIIEERKREFCGLGVFRWHDMRRLYNDPLFAGTVYKHYKYDQSAGLVETYTLKPERLTLRFPKTVIYQNPGFQQNP